MAQRHFQRFWKFSLFSLANRLMLTSIFLFDVVVAGRQGDAFAAGIMVAIPMVLLIHAVGNGLSQAIASRLTWEIGKGEGARLWPSVKVALGSMGLCALGTSGALMIFGPWLCTLLADTDQQLSHAQAYLWAMVPYASGYVVLMAFRETALALARADVAFYQTVGFFICKLGILTALELQGWDAQDTVVYGIGMSSTWGTVVGVSLGGLLLGPYIHATAIDALPAGWRLNEISSTLRQGLYCALVPASYGAFYAVLIMLFLKLGSEVTAARSYTGEMLLVLSAWPWAVATWGRIGVGLSCGERNYVRLKKYLIKTTTTGFAGVYPILILLYVFSDPLIALISPDEKVADVASGMLLVGLIGEAFRILSISIMNVLIAMDEVQGFAAWGVVLTWVGVLPLMLALDDVYQSYMLLSAFFYVEYMVRTVLGAGYLYRAVSGVKMNWKHARAS